MSKQVEERTELPVLPGDLAVSSIPPGEVWYVTSDLSSAPQNLSIEGQLDWVHFGDQPYRGPATPQEHKVSESPNGAIGYQLDYSSTITGVSNYSGDPRALGWNDGTSLPTSNGSAAGLSTFGAGNGFAITAPADTTPRTLVVHVGGYYSAGQIEVYFSDNSIAPYVLNVVPIAGQYDRNYYITYQARSAATDINVFWTMEQDLGNGFITVSGAALSPGTTVPTTPGGAAAVSVTPGNLTLTSPGVGQAGPTQSVTLTNLSSVTLTVALTPSAGFTVSSTMLMPANGKATVNVAFDPTSVTPSTQMGTLHVTLNGQDVTGSPVMLTGTIVPTSGGGVVSVAPVATLTSPGVNQTVAQPVTVTNTGSAPVTVALNTLPPFSVPPTLTVPANGSAMANVSFTPTSATPATQPGTLHVTLNGQDVTGSPVSLSGTVTATTSAAQVSVTPSSLANLSSLTSPGVNQAGPAQPIVLLNAGSAAAAATVTATGPFVVASASGGPFSASVTLNVPGSNGTANVYVAFSPTSATPATQTGSLAIAVNGQPINGSPFALSGAIVSHRVSGVADSTTTSKNLTTEGTLDWYHFGDPNIYRKAGGAGINITPATIPANATGYTKDPRPLAWTDPSIFGPVTDNTDTSATQGVRSQFIFTVVADTNPRTLYMHVGGLNALGTFTAKLMDGSAIYTETFPDAQSAAATYWDRNYTLVYTAASTTTLQVTWTLATNYGAAGNPGIITFAAVALASGGTTLPTATVSVAPGSVTLTSPGVNQAGSTQPVTVTNPGSSPVTVALSASAGFSVSAMSLPVAANSSAMANVSFTPTSATPATQPGTLHVTLNGQDVTGSPVSLSGTVTTSSGTPKVSAPSSIGFGSVIVGTKPTMQVNISNAGTASLNISSLTPTGVLSLVSPPSTFPLLAPGASQQVTVQINVSAAGAQAGTLNVASNDPSRPNLSIPLVATAFSPVTNPLVSDTFQHANAGDCTIPQAAGSGGYYYLPIFPDANGLPIGATITSGALQNSGLDFGGVQFTSSATPCNGSQGATLPQDLDIRMDILVPLGAAGQITDGGPYFRSRAATAGNGIVGGTSTGYWVELFSTGVVNVTQLNPFAQFAATLKPSGFDATVPHTLEAIVQGSSLQVNLDGVQQSFAGSATVTLPVAANAGAAGIAFGDEMNRGMAGGQRVNNLVILSTTAAPTGLSAGLIGYWPFEGSPGDTSGQGANLTLQGGAAIGAEGVSGQAVNLPGNNNSYAIGSSNDTAFDFAANDFSIQVWFKTASFSKQQTLIEKFTGASGPGWTLTVISSTELQFYSSPVGPLDVNGLPANVWNQIVVTRRGATVSIYINGVLAGTNNYGTTAIATSANPLLVGKRNSGDTRDFSVDGSLDQIAIWNRALSPAEVSALFKANGVI